MNVWDKLTQHILQATLGSASKPFIKATRRGFRQLSLITASGSISQTLPTVHAAVSRTTTLWSANSSINIGMACSTIGFNLSGSGPSNIEPGNI